MNCGELAARIERMHPETPVRDVARLCLLLANNTKHLDRLGSETELSSAWQEMGLRLQAATDQHVAMSEELETLAGQAPEKFSADQIWMLIRAIKVQSQVLQLYVGTAVDAVT